MSYRMITIMGYWGDLDKPTRRVDFRVRLLAEDEHDLFLLIKELIDDGFSINIDHGKVETVLD